MLEEKIELLAPRLLDELRPLVEEFRALSEELSVGLGWHYLLDLAWAGKSLDDYARPGARCMDAGAGIGLMQWWLARRGVDVISADRGSRQKLHKRFRAPFSVIGLRGQDLIPLPEGIVQANTSATVDDPAKAPGKVYIYNQNMMDLCDIGTESLDFVVSISSLEHNPPDDLLKVMDETMRVLKPGAPLIATLGAGKDQDWYHEQSKGWCYTAASLKRHLSLGERCPDNYSEYGEMFNAMRNCDELKANLAKFYFESGDNGMPWGKWDPKYLTVGIVKIKNS